MVEAAMTAATKSWRTTALGAIAMIAIILPQLKLMLDSDASTVADWNIIILAVSTFLGFSQARDNGVKSESAGAK